MRRIFAASVLCAAGACALFPDLGGLSEDGGVDVIGLDASADVTSDAPLDAKSDSPAVSDADTRIKNITFENGLIVDAVLGVGFYNAPGALLDASTLADAFSVATVQPAPDASDQESSFTQDFGPKNKLYVSMLLRVDAPPSAVARFVKIGNTQTTVALYLVPDTPTTFLFRYKVRLTTTGTSEKTIGDSVQQPVGQTLHVGLYLAQQSSPDAGDAVIQGWVAPGFGAFGSPFVSSTQETLLGPTDEIALGASTTNFVAITIDNIRLDSAKMPEP